MLAKEGHVIFLVVVGTVFNVTDLRNGVMDFLSPLDQVTFPAKID
jgi:hypothetical protein